MRRDGVTYCLVRSYTEVERKLPESGMPTTAMNMLLRASTDADVSAMLAIFAITFRAGSVTLAATKPNRSRTRI